MDRIPISSRMRDISGQRFGRLIAQYPVKCNQRTAAFWFCQCDCGETKVVRQDLLKNGNNKSCGCWLRESSWDPTTHGLSHTKVHRTWTAIKTRCYNPNCERYPRYGGRGIRVCERWMSSFDSFLKDMGFPPSDKHSIDRIDNDGHYSPDNCRWATAKQQANNKSPHHK